ncbi:MarR family winged helix-turn-helix transcriptional regulator [Variovorax sp. YR752]|uniref:MarR family winged helix-turn-helix transcriptional regulator n=1 Tax=Variovorax sp. YR752 TaxID=1884383 RepID=UPI0031378380
MPKSVAKVNHIGGAGATPDPAVADVGEKLHALVHRLRQHQRQELLGQSDEATPMEWRALAFFAGRPGACARDLVEHSGRDKAQVARLVRLLIERGCLEASAAPNDQRVQQLHLTAAGRREAQRLREARERIDRRMMSALSAQDRRRLCELLDRLHDSLGEP